MTELQPSAGGIVFDEQHRLLVIRRGQSPSQGAWSVPGGRCRVDEPADAACVREVAEETGLHVRVVRHAGQVVRGPFVIDDFVCVIVGGTLHAGDDAADARWVTKAELAALPLVPLLWETLAAWSLLPD